MADETYPQFDATPGPSPAADSGGEKDLASPDTESTTGTQESPQERSGDETAAGSPPPHRVKATPPDASGEESGDTSEPDAVAASEFQSSLPEFVRSHKYLSLARSPEEFELILEQLVLPEEPVTADFDYAPGKKGHLPGEHDAFIRTWAAELGLSSDQAQKMMDSWGVVQENLFDIQRQEYGDFAKAAQSEIRKEYGDAYERQLERATAAARACGGEELLDFLRVSGLGNVPALVRAFVKAADLIGEDLAPGMQHIRERTPKFKEETNSLGLPNFDVNSSHF